MKRGALLFVIWVGGGLLLWWFQQQRIERASLQQQQLLFRLGAPEPNAVQADFTLGPEDLAYRDYLTGNFQAALQGGPSSDLYETVASLFLASHGLTDPKAEIQALAVGTDLLARVKENSLEFFSSDGHPLHREVFWLDENLTSSTSALEPLTLPFQLEAQGDWILVRDQTRSAAFRFLGQSARGYLSEQRIEVTENGDLKCQDQIWRLGPQGKLLRL